MSSSDKQGKTELNISSHQQKDKDKSGDYNMQDVDKSQDKHTKTQITFEHKKVDDKSVEKDKDNWGKDKDLNKDLGKDKKEFHYESKDLNKDKDWNKDKDFNKDLHKDKDMHDKSEGSKAGGIINTIKEKVKDVLQGSGETKEKDKDVHMSSVDKNKEEKFGSSTVGVASSGTSGSSAQYHSSNLGSSNLGSSNLGSSNLSSDKQFVGSAAGTGYSGAPVYSGAAAAPAYSSAAPIHSGAAPVYSSGATAHHAQATIDHKNLGAEHRELGYEKQQPAVIPSKEKDKDTAHRVDIQGSLYTSGAGSTYKTNEAK
jgi:hypothetical protein